jgi:putative membrane protein
MLSIITMPIIRNFGISMPLELFKYTLAQFTEKETASTQQLERFLDKIGETVNIHVGVICFKKKRKEAAKDKINMLKSVVVVPALHPGPFGYVGGGNLPTKLMRELNHIAEHVLVAHGSATHDLNPTTGKECNKIAHEIKRMIADTKYSATCSKFIRVPGDEGCNICAQYFGDAVILVYTSAPYPTDDVEYSIGMNARLIAKTQARDAIFIDAHNCLDRKTGDVLFGSRKSFELLQLIEHACKRAGQASVMSIGLRIGIAQSKKFKHEQGLGEQGIQVLVVETGGSQRVAYILYDGNNMVPNLREKILHSVKGLVDDAEVLTTDNHVVNLTIGGYNPVGMKIRSELLIATTRELVQLAIDDLEDVEVGINSKIISNIRVLGNQNTIRLTTTINAMLSILLKTFIICETLAVLGCWAFYLTLTGW